jgi:hypothetical protein
MWNYQKIFRYVQASALQCTKFRLQSHADTSKEWPLNAEIMSVYMFNDDMSQLHTIMRSTAAFL